MIPSFFLLPSFCFSQAHGYIFFSSFFFILFSFFSCRLSTNSMRFFIQSSARHPTVSLLPLMHIIFLKIYSQFSLSYDHFVCFFPSSNPCFLLAFLLWQNHTHVLSCWKPFRLFFFVCVYFSLISGLTKWVSELVPDSFLPPHYLWFFFFLSRLFLLVFLSFLVLPHHPILFVPISVWREETNNVSSYVMISPSCKLSLWKGNVGEKCVPNRLELCSVLSFLSFK